MLKLLFAVGEAVALTALVHLGTAVVLFAAGYNGAIPGMMTAHSAKHDGRLETSLTFAPQVALAMVVVLTIVMWIVHTAGAARAARRSTGSHA